jgi:hypothetical protein
LVAKARECPQGDRSQEDDRLKINGYKTATPDCITRLCARGGSMSLCENVYRCGGVYWWRTKVVSGEPPAGRTIALSLCVREPARARRMAVLLNARFLCLW